MTDIYIAALRFLIWAGTHRVKPWRNAFSLNYLSLQHSLSPPPTCLSRSYCSIKSFNILL